MPNTILKRWNGTAFEELYPKTTPSQIAASGTPSSSTFLRGDGQWAVPSGVDNYVNITGDTMTGTLTANGGITVPGFTNLLATGIAANTVYTPDLSQIAQAPFGGVLWHDVLAFNRIGTPTFEVSTNGTTFTSSSYTPFINLFAMKENQAIEVINPSSRKAARFILPNMAWTIARWLVIGHTYVASAPNITVLVESSANGVNWTARHNSTRVAGATPAWYILSDFNGDNTLRLTITHNSGGNVILSSIRMLTTRWGDQGRGKEWESPFDWDGNRNVTTTGTLTGTRLISTIATGTSPLTVASSTLVTNLNADLLDSNHGTYFDHRRYTDATNYLGGFYVGGGSEKPNNTVFGPGKFKVAMLSKSNLGFGGTWNDVMWLSTYTGSDVKSSHALVFDKYSTDVWVADQNFDSASWGTGYRLWHEGNFEPNVDTLDVLPTYGESNENFIKYNTTERAVEVQGSDNSFGAVFPAFKIYSGAKYQISFQIKSNVAVSEGVYFRIQEYDEALPAGKTHISNAATHPEVQEDTRQITGFYENSSVGVSWSNHSFVYTPTATAQWTSVLFLNWTGLGTNSLFIKNLKISAVNENADSLSGITSSQFLRSDVADTATQINSPIFSGDIATSGNGQDNYPFRLTSDYSSYMVATSGNAWGLFWAGNDGAKYGTNGTGGPGNIWGNSTNPNEFVFVGGDSTVWSVYGSNGNVWQKGTLTTGGNITAPSILVDDYIFSSGDTNTYIRFIGADDMQLVAGGRQMLRMDEGTDPDRLRFVTDDNWTDSSGNWNMSGNLTVNGNVFVDGDPVWHEGNDGTGSGLDADLLDGNEASAFLLTTARGTANGVASLDSNSKIPVSQMPVSVIGGLKFAGSFTNNTNPSSPLNLSEFITGVTTTGYSISATLDSISGVTHPAYDATGNQWIGSYWIATNAVRVEDEINGVADWRTNPAAFDDGRNPEDSGGGIHVSKLDIEAGDWLIITGYDATNKIFFFNVINNTYDLATASAPGIMSAADKTKLDGIAASANNYTHPTHPGDDINIDTGPLTGATVISDLDFNVTTDTLGHVTDANAVIATRTLTAANIGAAATSHTHGNIQNNGTITASPVAIESGDTLLIANNNNSQLIERGVAFGTATTTFLRNDGAWATPTDTTTLTGLGVTSTAAELNVLDGITATTTELNYTDGVTSNIQTQLNAKLNLTGGTVSGNLTLTGQLNLSEDHFIHRKFLMNDADNSNPAYIILVRNAAGANDVNGRITMDRTSGLRHAVQYDIVVSAGTSVAPVGTIISHATAGSDGAYGTLVTLTYNSLSYVAVKLVNPDNYYESTGAYFTGRIKSTDATNIFKVLKDANVSNVLDFAVNGQHRIDADKIFTDGYHPNADTLTTARTLTIGSTGKTFNGSANVSWTLAEIGAQVAGSYAAASHTHPISSITNLQSALDSAATLASPGFTGTPTAPTATAGTNTTQIATTAFVSTAVANLINSAPGALDTLDELAAALGDDANFASTVTAALAGKAATSHTHTVSNISNRGNIGNNLMLLQNTTTSTRFLKLNPDHSVSVESGGTYLTSIGAAATSHTHTIANVTDLQTTLNGKAATSHTHTIANVTGLQIALDGKSNTDHVHAINDVANLQTTLDGKAATSHSHSTANITSGTLGLARGGTGNTSVTAGGVVFGATGGGSYTNTSAPTGTTQYLGASFNGVNNQPAWTTPSNSTTRTVLSSALTNLATEREVYWGTRYMHIGVTPVAGANVNRTLTFTAGMKNFILQLHQDTTTGAVIARLPLTISNSVGTSTDTNIYSLDASPRIHRVAWSNGGGAQILNVTISYNTTTRVVTMSQNFNFNCAFRLFGF